MRFVLQAGWCSWPKLLPAIAIFCVGRRLSYANWAEARPRITRMTGFRAPVVGVWLPALAAERAIGLSADQQY